MCTLRALEVHALRVQMLSTEALHVKLSMLAAPNRHHDLCSDGPNSLYELATRYAAQPGMGIWPKTAERNP